MRVHRYSPQVIAFAQHEVMMFTPRMSMRESMHEKVFSHKAQIMSQVLRKVFKRVYKGRLDADTQRAIITWAQGDPIPSTYIEDIVEAYDNDASVIDKINNAIKTLRINRDKRNKQRLNAYRVAHHMRVCTPPSRPPTPSNFLPLTCPCIVETWTRHRRQRVGKSRGCDGCSECTWTVLNASSGQEFNRHKVRLRGDSGTAAPSR